MGSLAPALFALLLSLLFSLLSAACTPDPAPVRSSPNVLLVVIDTARADHLSSYGFPKLTSPALDQLALSSVRYERAYATSNWTLPSHASLFTGLYPSEARTSWETPHLPQGVQTLAERLQDAGYRTRAASGNSWISSRTGFDQGFEEFVDAWRTSPARPSGPAVEEPIRWIREFAGSGEPFFIFLNYNRAHMPYSPEPAYRKLFVDERHPRDRVLELAQMKGDVLGLHGLEPEDFEIMSELYAAEVRMVDWDLGRVLSTLEESGLLERTLVIVTGDHGENIGEQGVVGHSVGMYEPTLRVPLIIRYPERFPPGSVRGELVSLVDLMHTILEVCGLSGSDLDADLESRSLVGGRYVPRTHVVSEAARPLHMLELVRKELPERLDEIDHPVRAVRGERHKLVWNEDRGLELFDLAADPAESVDLAGREPEIERRLLRRLEEWQSALAMLPEEPPLEAKDEEMLEHLRSLGYLH